MPSEKPTTAFVLSLIGGIFVIIGGLATAAIGAALTFFIGGIGGIIGLIGVFWGILIVVFAVMLNSNPKNHTTYGALILIFSLLSWFGSFGGLFIGFLLGLIGGILAITWNPTVQTPTQAPITRICPSCGNVLDKDAKFCPACGKQFP
ncbi:MAG: DUF6114 domain-containing protein [Nitrososphaerales archaeon]